MIYMKYSGFKSYPNKGLLHQNNVSSLNVIT